MMTKRQISRTPVLYLTLGFIGGVIISRNAEPLTNAETGAVIIGLALMTFFAWRSGIRGKNEAVAVAVSTAVASANARAEASAKAVANQAVQIVLGAPGLGYGNPAVMHDSRESAIEEAHEFIEGWEFDSEQSRSHSHS